MSQQRLSLDEAALDAARRDLDDGAVTPTYGPWRDDIVGLLNGALATELIAERIVQLGGDPDFHPDRLLGRSHAGYDEVADLKAMIRSNLVAERVAVETYRQMIALVADKDPTTRRMLEQILADEEEHADELSDWLAA
jgi:bacterioferritin